VRWAAPEILNKQRPVSRKSDVYSFAMVFTEAFTGKAPFYGVVLTTVALGVLAGKRPPRPAHRDLTDDLWEMVERCWNEDPQHRPEISEVILCLRTTLALRCDPPHVNDNQALDATALHSGKPWELSIGLHFRPSRWAPVSYVLRRFRKFFPAPRSTSDAEPGKDAQTGEREKVMNTQHRSPGTSDTPRQGFWFSRYSPLRRSRRACQRQKIKAAPPTPVSTTLRRSNAPQCGGQGTTFPSAPSRGVCDSGARPRRP